MRRRSAYTAFAAPDAAPISEMNTTPLIDVMLVLLIMFILTVPLATHGVKIDLPQAPPWVLDKEPDKHRLAFDGAGSLFWDGAPLAEAALPGKLNTFSFARPDGVLEIQSDPETRYETFDRVLATVKRSRVTNLGFVGNERYQGELN
jgi:biopolymer transport protein ExbD